MDPVCAYGGKNDDGLFVVVGRMETGGDFGYGLIGFAFVIAICLLRHPICLLSSGDVVKGSCESREE
jgi:hypothetical protein